MDSVDGDSDHSINLFGTIAGTSTGAFELSGSSLGTRVYSLANVNVDSYSDLLIGTEWSAIQAFLGGDVPADHAVYYVSGSEWQSSDNLDGTVDGKIDLDRLVSRPTSWKFESKTGIGLGASVASCGDLDGDSVPDVMIGAPAYSSGTHSSSGAIFALSGAKLDAADTADGETDGVVDIGEDSDAIIWKLVSNDLFAGKDMNCLGDKDGDGLADFLIGADEGVYVIAGGDLVAADAADGASDDVIELVNVIMQPNSWQFRGTVLGGPFVFGQAIGDMDGDGFADVMVVSSNAVNLISGHRLQEIEAVDGFVNIISAPLPARSWKLVLSAENTWFTLKSSTADLNGDGNPEVILESENYRTGATSTYVISPSELSVAASLQGLAGNIIYLDQLARRWEED